jgi:hypothetical protein
MGKLAERYDDCARSGVYRVRLAAIPRAAAEEAGARILELTAHALANGAWTQVEQMIEQRDARARVVLIEGGAALAAQGGRDYALLMDTLHDAARTCRATGRPFFAVLIDPAETLALPLLYKERADRPPRT